MTAILMASLGLVYPPVSSQEAEWLKTDEEVVALIRGSDFYLIGIRPQLTFGTVEGRGAHLTVEMTDGSGLSDQLGIDVETVILNFRDEVPETSVVSWGENVLEIWAGTDDELEAGSAELIEWFTPAKIVRDRCDGMPGLHGLERKHEFATYELLYVGIATSTDTFERLFDGAHKARQSTLTNEWPRRTGARVADEITLFAFRVEPWGIRELGPSDDPISFTDESWKELHKRVVADAEKAFIHLLDPGYNVQKYAGYPRSTDGLWNQGFTRYGFVLLENMTFTTVAETFRGSVNRLTGLTVDGADMLLTEGDKTELWRPDE